MNVVSRNRKTGSWKVILIITIIIVLICAVTFAYLFLKTDIFKSNEELFWKYMAQNVEMVDEIKIKKDARYENQSYNMKSTLSFDLKEELSNYNDLKFNIETKHDNESDRTYSKIDGIFKETKLCNIEYLRNNNIYALKNEEVANGYIGFENENIRELVNKMDQDSTEIPDRLNIPDVSELLSVTKEEKQHIVDTYYNVVKSNINKKKYNKTKKVTVQVDENQYVADAYSVILTKREYQTLKINTLETLKTDSITLNLLTTKMKSLNKESKYANINNLNEEISKKIEEIKQEEVSDEQYIKYTVYVNNGKTICTNVEIINKFKITISHLENQNKIIITNESNEKLLADCKQIVFINKYSDSEEYLYLEIKLEQDKNIFIEVKKQKNDGGYLIEGKVDLYGSIINIKGELVLTEKETIPELSQTSNLIVNNLDKAKINVLKTKLEEQIKKVIQSKKDIINPPIVEEPIQVITDII